jgi:iron complex transport system substrate-binding protein
MGVLGALTLRLLLSIAEPIWAATQPRAPFDPQIPSATSAGTTVVDGVGRRVEIPVQVKRVVTLSPDLTETIYALGLEERLAGDTNYCDTPAAAKLKPHVGTIQNPSLEAIVALRPDVVFASTSINRRETVDALARLGLAVYATNPHTVRGVLDSVARVANVMGAVAQGQTLVAQLQERLDALQMRLANLPLAHVLFVVWQDPLITIGPNTFIADALRWAGAESVILAEQNWPQISFEEVVRLQPDYIVFTSNHSGGSTALLADLRSRRAWKGLRAVEMGHVLEISDEIARPSPGLVDAIEQLARNVHSEAFRGPGAHDTPVPEKREQISRMLPSAQECTACIR